MAILQRPYAGQVKNLTPPAAGCGGWFLAVGGVICCGRWAAGLAGCGVGRCWRWAAGCCEVWQGVQAVQLVGCGVIGAALAVPVLPGAGGWRNIRVPRPALPGYFPAFPRGGRRQHPARAGLLIRQAGQAGRWAKEKGQGRRRGVRCCSGLWSALAVRSAAPGASRCRRLALYPGILSTLPGAAGLHLIRLQRFRLAVLHPVRFCRLPEGSDSPPNGIERQV